MVAKTDEEIKKSINKIIHESGNTLHCKVLKYLENKKWSTLVSPYYTDILSTKPREIDLIAEKPIIIYERGPFSSNVVLIKLFIECKYVRPKTVFWFHTKDREKTKKLIESTIPHDLETPIAKDHHYLKDLPVAKLFASENSNSTENNLFFKALNQTLNAMIYYRNKRPIDKIDDNLNVLETLKYSIIICNSFENLYSIGMGSDEEPYKISDNFLMEVNYAYLMPNGIEKEEYFLIDIIDFNKIDQFFELIENDAKITANFKPKTSNMVWQNS